ncbi:ABC transporter permease [Salsipaludibacter albus]|uniref:ABC transporter permease n=1 Tax=Salsipaludibacter albus TaxID=2849650 RepID=UPI001EE40C4D|nr:ABC transporter permease [Salsipaludibacter albus]MBY5162824.1 ABC transporter permease [Salsipaludibacter albus]
MLELLDMVQAFLAEPNRWSFTEPAGIPYRLVEHLWTTAVAMVIAAVLALPPAMWLAHERRGEAIAGALVNIGRAIPSFGLIVVFVLFAIERGNSGQFWPLVLALVALAIPPIFTNAYTGIFSVDPDLVEAARGQGMSGGQVFRQVELPLGTAVVLTGLRISLVQVLATVGIGAIVTSGGGLGRYVVDGFAIGVNGYGEVFTGAVLLAGLVLAVEWVFEWLQRRLLPTGLQVETDPDAGMTAVGGA